MKKHITVTSPSLENRDEWEKLYYGYADFYHMPMNQDILNTVWSWIFDSNTKFYCLFAKDESGIGLGLMHYREMPSPIQGTMVGFLDDLFIKPDCRGQGIVDLLYETLTKEAINHGWSYVRWITADNNYRGRGVYDKIAEKTYWLTYQMPV